MRIRLILGALVLLAGWRVSAQQPSFEVASIKQNVSEMANGGAGPRGDMFVATNVPLKALLVLAYSRLDAYLLDAQIVGGPDWIKTDRFDIQAKAPRPISGAESRVMLRSLLEDRFQLKAHLENRELPVYNLVLGKNGPKLSADQTPPDPSKMFISFGSADDAAVLPRGAMKMISGPTSTTLKGTAISVPQIVRLLQGKSDRIVVDKTGFTGLIDLQLEFSQDAVPDVAPLLFTAIQDLGLKLESAKAPMEVLVVDSVQIRELGPMLFWAHNASALGIGGDSASALLLGSSARRNKAF